MVTVVVLPAAVPTALPAVAVLLSSQLYCLLETLLLRSMLVVFFSLCALLCLIAAAPAASAQLARYLKQPGLQRCGHV